jgi:hypothetical protein
MAGDKEDPRSRFFASALTAAAFSVLPMQMHDRYLHPALPLLAMIALLPRGWPWFALFSFAVARLARRAK